MLGEQRNEGLGQRLAGRRAEIVSEAARLFDESGYHQVSMEDIAEAIGLRKPTLYHYFQGKDEILFFIHEEFVDLLIERNEARDGARLSPSQRLLEMMGDIVELMHTHHGHVRVFFEHHRELPESRFEPIKAKRDRYFAMLNDVIEEGVRRGEMETEDARLTTLAVFGMCNWAYKWYRPDGPLRPREIAYHLWGLVMHGVSTEHPG